MTCKKSCCSRTLVVDLLVAVGRINELAGRLMPVLCHNQLDESNRWNNRTKTHIAFDFGLGSFLVGVTGSLPVLADLEQIACFAEHAARNLELLRRILT